MQPVDRDFGDELSDPVDRLVVSLRAYITRGREKPKKDTKKGKAKARRAYVFDPDAPRTPPSDWVLIFDCETHTTSDQRLRFGGYQLRYKGQLWERGAFYEPKALRPREKAVLRQVMDYEKPGLDDERIRLLTKG